MKSITEIINEVHVVMSVGKMDAQFINDDIKAFEQDKTTALKHIADYKSQLESEEKSVAEINTDENPGALKMIETLRGMYAYLTLREEANIKYAEYMIEGLNKLKK